MEHKIIDWEVIYNIRIVSLNSIWRLNSSQLYRLPLLKKIFHYDGFRDDSYLEESEIEKLNNFSYFENITLKKKEYFIILEDIFEEDHQISPETINFLKDINWIFEIPEKDWSLPQKQIYKLVNPEYDYIQNLYECINCKIKTTKEFIEMENECRFHLNKLEFNNDLICESCGYSFINGSGLNSGCKYLPKHIFVPI